MKLRLLVALIPFLISASLFGKETYAELIAQAEKDAPTEVQLHVIKTGGRLSSFTAKVREVGQIPGWQQIRAKGDAAHAVWDNLRKDYVWQTEKFEVVWDIIEARKLKLNSVSLGGIERKVDS